MKVQVFVRLKPGVLDVQGKAVEHGLHEMGFGDVHSVRVGKLIEFDCAGAAAAAVQAKVKQMCDALLANTVIESYEIKVQG
ncbi:MAG: phosphoribosylformylglycinamidine synthase subunit PurS [Bdellovibrionota bacterium]|nr:MAG: phosphoribosylformylglycinamidine synthase subunit PurS [Bdellovibrionota bacterium]